MHEAHLALMDSVASGDVAAIKLYYEMTGRWSSKTVGDMNIEFVLMRILEILQQHIRDPELLERIGNDFLKITPNQISNIHQAS